MEQEGIVVCPGRETIPVVAEYVSTMMEQADVSMKVANKMNIAVDEIFANIAFYSGASQAQAICHVTDERVTVIFRDDGKPFNPLDNEDPDISLSAEERDVGGLGVFMTKKLMSEVSYRYVDGKNEMTLMIRR